MPRLTNNLSLSEYPPPKMESLTYINRFFGVAQSRAMEPQSAAGALQHGHTAAEYYRVHRAIESCDQQQPTGSISQHDQAAAQYDDAWPALPQAMESQSALQHGHTAAEYYRVRRAIESRGQEQPAGNISQPDHAAAQYDDVLHAMVSYDQESVASGAEADPEDAEYYHARM